MDQDAFEKLVARVTGAIAGKPLDAALARMLDRDFPPTGAAFQAIQAACHQAIAAGWMCSREAGGIRYGRVVKPSPALAGFSVDVVQMADIKGPYHRHPKGEIDMIMPLSPGAVFDGHGAGWCVYGPGTAHHPTVSGGAALVLYLLPEGAIEFTKA
ncbi:MAG TPA: DUF4863 family protein [Alphaproteobacteria bacterium]|nr:DUF4863 family protein [Alphaproteobacteria bacterium]